MDQCKKAESFYLEVNNTWLFLENWVILLEQPEIQLKQANLAKEYGVMDLYIINIGIGMYVVLKTAEQMFKM
jgi:hypothetical protein